MKIGMFIRERKHTKDENKKKVFALKDSKKEKKD